MDVSNIRGEASILNVIAAISGVPYDSHPGLFSFNLFINDLTIEINSCLLNTDDLELLSSMKWFRDCLVLQNEVHAWCTLNKLDHNIPECKVTTCRVFDQYLYLEEPNSTTKTQFL